MKNNLNNNLVRLAQERTWRLDAIVKIQLIISRNWGLDDNIMK